MSTTSHTFGSGIAAVSTYNCDFCRKAITDVSLRCNECDDFDLCLACFSSGVELGKHKNSHDYRIVDQTKIPIFHPDWGADEEKMLVDGLRRHGMGNWEDIAFHVFGNQRTKADIRKHYFDIYLNSATTPLPDMSTPLPGPNDVKPVSTIPPEPTYPRRGGNYKKKAAGAAGAAGGAKKNEKPKLALAHLVGYQARRGDFETEYEDNAEEILADMEFKVEDSDWERGLKLKVLEIYNSKLVDRAKRKQFILSRGLLEKKTEKRTKSGREAYNNMRVFARFHSAQEHEAFISGLVNEQRLRKRIETLQNYRLNGISTLSEASIYEKQKIKKNAQRPNQKSAAYLFDKDPPKKIGSKRALSQSQAQPLPLTGGSNDPTMLGASSPRSLTKVRRIDSGPVSVSSLSVTAAVNSMAGADKLTEEEKKLVQDLELTPLQFLEIKERVAKESFVRGILKPGQARQLFKIDINKSERILDFFVSLGWLIATPAAVRPDVVRFDHSQDQPAQGSANRGNNANDLNEGDNWGDAQVSNAEMQRLRQAAAANGWNFTTNQDAIIAARAMQGFTPDQQQQFWQMQRELHMNQRNNFLKTENRSAVASSSISQVPTEAVTAGAATSSSSSSSGAPGAVGSQANVNQSKPVVSAAVTNHGT